MELAHFIREKKRAKFAQKTTDDCEALEVAADIDTPALFQAAVEAETQCDEVLPGQI